MSRTFRPLAGTVFVLYLTLVNIGAWCQVSHYSSPEVEHQHTTPASTHSPLCAWACAVSVASSTVQISSVSLEHLAPQLEELALTPLPVAFQLSLEFGSTRAPPRSLFIV